MARADLLVQLVKSGSNGDRVLFKKVTEAIIAEERSKQHHSLADKLEENLQVSHNNPAKTNSPTFYLNGSKRSESYVDNYLSQTTPFTRLNDLVLSDDVLSICHEVLEEHNRVDLLRSYNLEPRHRVLFVGPPGNGKTSLAEAIACELMLPFYSVKYENIVASYLGETSQRLKNLFDYVRNQQCVLFFDEFDSISKERADKHETGEIKRLVSSLLLQMDQLPSYVIIIAATNHSELLDKAVWRRFQIKLSLNKPDQRSIQAFIDHFQNIHQISFGCSTLQMAKQFTGLSFSEIKDICTDILRKYVLSMPNKNSNDLKEFTKKRLSQMKVTAKPVK